MSKLNDDNTQLFFLSDIPRLNGSESVNQQKLYFQLNYNKKNVMLYYEIKSLFKT